MKSIIKRLVTGISFSQEYLCLDKKDFESPLSVSYKLNGKEIDITSTHLFLGYRPLILGIVVNLNDVLGPELELEFRSASGERVAMLQIRKINQLELGNRSVFFYEGVYGYHRFLGNIYQWINRQRNKFRKRKLGSADLHGNDYDQVRIAYSIPRTISVITVSNRDRINMFPTDLHGPVGNDFYISSLRIGGLANSQVEEYKRIVLSEVCGDQFRKVYGLGKNHMKPLRHRSEFETKEELSSKFRYPLPKGKTGYHELELVRSFDHGIHRIHVYKVEHREKFDQNSVLTHIHNYYGQWRVDRKLTTVFLIR